jgi:type VI protein secretion system component Hcp
MAIFLKIPGIHGATIEVHHKGWIPIESLKFSVSSKPVSVKVNRKVEVGVGGSNKGAEYKEMDIFNLEMEEAVRQVEELQDHTGLTAIEMTRVSDVSSYRLMSACGRVLEDTFKKGGGSAPEKVQIHVTSGYEDKARPYLSLELEGVVITKFLSKVDAGQRATENVDLQFEKVTLAPSPATGGKVVGVAVRGLKKKRA